MGTRGFKIVRFQGRYYAYYNHWDSYPEVLGRLLVDEIPVDPEQYEEWLREQRALYAQIAADLENKVLTVTDEMLQGYRFGNEPSTPCQLLDERLEELPSFLSMKATDLFIEWTYTIDLDREIFSVNSQIHFNMRNIPRDRWMEGFNIEAETYEDEVENEDQIKDKDMHKNEHDHKEKEEEDSQQDEEGSQQDGEGSQQDEKGSQQDEESSQQDGEGSQQDDEEEPFRQEFSFRICPEATDRYPVLEPRVNDASTIEYKAKYQQYNCTIVKPKNALDLSSKNAAGKIMTVLLFAKFSEHVELKKSFRYWSHDEFAFREVAFAILSLAKRQYRLDEVFGFNGEASNGYLIDRNEEGRHDNSVLMPIFGVGCHSPGELIGSAPDTSIYWFDNVLVSLVPDSDISKDAEAAIAKAAEFGLGERKHGFHAVVFSLVNVVMLEVLVENGVTAIKRTKTIMLPARKDDFGDGNTIEAYCQAYAGFISLISFLGAAADLEVSYFTQGYFPTEIYTKILSSADLATRNACGKVSRPLRELIQESLPFGRDLMLTRLTANLQDEPDQWKFLFRERNTGEMIESGIGRRDHRRNPREVIRAWSPVIGSKRPSIIPEIQFVFIKLTRPIQKFATKFETGERAPNRDRLLRGGIPVNPFERPIAEWQLPLDAVMNHLENLWCNYFKIFFAGSEDGITGWDIQPNSRPCTLIPHYRELSILLYPQRKEFWVCIRRSIDGDTLQKRAKTLTYVTAKLLKHAKDNMPVMVIFGTDARLYHWKDNGKEELLELLVQCEDFREKKSRLEFETKFLGPLKDKMLKAANTEREERKHRKEIEELRKGIVQEGEDANVAAGDNTDRDREQGED